MTKSRPVLSLSKGLFERLSVRLTAAFLLAAMLGVALVTILSYRSTASDFQAFLSHLDSMSGMMGGGFGDGMMGGMAAQAALEFMNNLGRTLWIAGILGVLLAIVLGALFTRQNVAPLGEVTAAARHVAKGDFQQRVNIHGSSELAELGESFNIMAETLSRDRQLRQNLVADVAHELRTPLSILRANVEAMQDGVLETSPENLASLHQETLLLSRLIDDLRTLSLADSGQLKFHTEPTDLRELSSRIIDSLQTQFASRKLHLSLEILDSLPPVMADPDRMEQVLRNLLSNAFHYTPEGGSVTVRLFTDGDGVTVSVIDTGVGISAEDLPRVFDRLYRVDRSRTRSTGGSGLGLAIVKQLVEAQDGRVWATSTIGQGSTFSFHLPAAGK
ncbi:MAG: HAMP domain-containing protein [Chloroflexi bacterium]|nr:HAMP domain-containing protein [Chloroflexota bacterium]